MTLSAVFEQLAVPRGGVLYVQSSTDWLQKAGFSAADALQTLREWTSGGALVMPSYPFRTTHLEYLETRPRFDVRRTPVAIGLIPELFRRTADVHRSLDPDFAIAASGADAEEIARTDLDEQDPFGARSVYARLIERGATMIGLGVSLNTNSFIHVIDSRVAASYPRPVYLGKFPAEVIDARGQTTTVSRLAIAPEFQRMTQPSAVAANADSHMHAATTVDGVNFFRWDLPRWSSWCEAHARAAVSQNAWPCWLSRLGEPRIQ